MTGPPSQPATRLIQMDQWILPVCIIWACGNQGRGSQLVRRTQCHFGQKVINHDGKMVSERGISLSKTDETMGF